MIFAKTVNLWYCLGFIPWVIVLLSMIADLNDIPRRKRSFRWILRRIGLVAAIIAAVTILIRPFTLTAFEVSQLTWLMPLIGFAWAVRLFTAPGQPPWSSKIWRDPVLNPVEPVKE